MQPITIHVNGVAKLLRNLKAHKATGPDQVPAKLLKDAADQLAPMLRTIFQASYDQESMPDAWRHADLSLHIRRATTPLQQTIGPYP